MALNRVLLGRLVSIAGSAAFLVVALLPQILSDRYDPWLAWWRFSERYIRDVCEAGFTLADLSALIVTWLPYAYAGLLLAATAVRISSSRPWMSVCSVLTGGWFLVAGVSIGYQGGWQLYCWRHSMSWLWSLGPTMWMYILGPLVAVSCPSSILGLALWAWRVRKTRPTAILRIAHLLAGVILFCLYGERTAWYFFNRLVLGGGMTVTPPGDWICLWSSIAMIVGACLEFVEPARPMLDVEREFGPREGHAPEDRRSPA